MKIILLSGGSGKRLWPLSNNIRSKQFLKLLKNDNGQYESMVQRVYGQIRRAGINSEIIIATCAKQVASIRNQLGNNVEVIVEPERRDTFPAIALACTHLSLNKEVDLEEIVVVLPVDPYVELDYFKLLIKMEEAAKGDEADLVLMGIKPTYPSIKYGYILPAKQDTDSSFTCTEEVGVDKYSDLYRVRSFSEKPSEEKARELISQGAVWNGGVFAFKLRYMMDIVNTHIQEAGLLLESYQCLESNYSVMKKTSFDYEVVERSSSIAMLLYKGRWKDLGTWSMLSEEIDDKYLGKVMAGEDTYGTTVINELPIPIIALGLKDVVVAASPDGILITDKAKSSALKSYVDGINNRPMYEENQWGEYRVLNFEKHEDYVYSLTKQLTVRAGKAISYQAHRIRDEILTVLSGSGDLILDGTVLKVRRGDVFTINKGQKHTIRAHETGDLHCVEIQIGITLEEDDYEQFEWEW